MQNLQKKGKSRVAKLSGMNFLIIFYKYPSIREV